METFNLQEEKKRSNSLDNTPSKCMPPPLWYLHICTGMTLTFDLSP